MNLVIKNKNIKLFLLSFSFLSLIPFITVTFSYGASPKPVSSVSTKATKKPELIKLDNKAPETKTETGEEQNIFNRISALEKQNTEKENKKDPNVAVFLLLITILFICNLAILFYFISYRKKAKIELKNTKKEVKTAFESLKSQNNENINKLDAKLNDSIVKINKFLTSLESRIIKLENELKETKSKPVNPQLRNDISFSKPETFSVQDYPQIVEIEDPVDLICNEHYSLTNRQFKENYEHQILEMTNSENVVYQKAEPIFQNKNTGKYLAINNPDTNQFNYLVFYARGTNISSSEKEINAVFNFDTELDTEKLYSEWKVIKPAVFLENNGNWQLKEKGKIKLEKN